MNDTQKRVAKFKFMELENAYLLMSSVRSKGNDEFLKIDGINISLLYDAGEWAAEWEPKYGPIQVWHKASSNSPNAREHYYYDYTDSHPLSWSQIAVEEYGLQEAFLQNDLKYIFQVLKDWCEGR